MISLKLGKSAQFPELHQLQKIRYVDIDDGNDLFSQKPRTTEIARH